MKLRIELERTFAGKQFENLKPRLSVELSEGVTPNEVRTELDKLKDVIEKFGADWKKEVLMLEGTTS